MLTQNQKKVVTGLGIGATTLGTVLLVHHHTKKEKRKSSKHHKLTKKEFLKDEARGAERERKYLERKLHLEPIIRRLKRESKPSRIVHYGNGVYCDNKTGKCYDDIIGNTEHVIVDGWLDSAEKHLFGGK